MFNLHNFAGSFRCTGTQLGMAAEPYPGPSYEKGWGKFLRFGNWMLFVLKGLFGCKVASGSSVVVKLNVYR